jgi:hypothetical protein
MIVQARWVAMGTSRRGVNRRAILRCALDDGVKRGRVEERGSLVMGGRKLSATVADICGNDYIGRGLG